MAPNIVLVSVDSLRADRFGPTGADGPPVPALEELADGGVVFENAVAPGPNTPSSMPAVFTGHHVYGIDAGIAMRDTIRKHVARTPTLPERLSSRGYTTLGYTPNPFTSRYFGFDRGFDEFDDFLSSRSRLRTHVVSRWMEGRFIAGLRFGLNMLGLGDLSVTWEDYYDELLATLREVEEPFFLWVFLLEPHWPYYPPKRFRGDSSRFEMFSGNWRRSKASSAILDESSSERLLSLYDGTIRHVDEFVSRIATDMDERDPVVVFHSDHGEAFGEHGAYGHGQYLYEENIHVPLVVGNVGESERIAEPVSLCQLPAMVSDIADFGRIDGRDYTDWSVQSYASEKVAIRGDGWKYISDADDGSFFDLRSDPEELQPVHDDRVIQKIDRVANRYFSQKRERQRISRVSDGIGRGRL